MNKSPRSLGAVLCGVIFSVAWWIFIDAVVWGQKVGQVEEFAWYYVLPGLGATLALIMMNMVTVTDAIGKSDDDGYDEGASRGRMMMVRAWLFIWLTCSFLCIAGGIWIMAAHYSNNWTGVGIVMQPVIISSSAGLLLYVRK